ncbi:unnamed protein product [Parnassius apollo]|uniref:(apollo) hypothetical protein n=1 Tax=Parnassius apollo TaxID=110799 RepID=A0A8S3Y7K5_PARAO|nr:unnamed protein product [Parnassius apollo]
MYSPDTTLSRISLFKLLDFSNSALVRWNISFACLGNSFRSIQFPLMDRVKASREVFVSPLSTSESAVSSVSDTAFKASLDSAAFACLICVRIRRRFEPGLASTGQDVVVSSRLGDDESRSGVSDSSTALSSRAPPSACGFLEQLEVDLFDLSGITLLSTSLAPEEVWVKRVMELCLEQFRQESDSTHLVEELRELRRVVNEYGLRKEPTQPPCSALTQDFRDQESVEQQHQKTELLHQQVVDLRMQINAEVAEIREEINSMSKDIKKLTVTSSNSPLPSVQANLEELRRENRELRDITVDSAAPIRLAIESLRKELKNQLYVGEADLSEYKCKSQDLNDQEQKHHSTTHNYRTPPTHLLGSPEKATLPNIGRFN